MSLVPSSSSGDSFNGGAITDALTIDDSAGDTAVAALTVTAPQHDAGEASFQTMVTVLNQDNHGVSIGAAGRVFIDANTSSQPALAAVQEGTADIFSAQDENFAAVFSVKRLGVIMMVGLPTVNPAVAGQLWSSAGTLKVSAG